MKYKSRDLTFISEKIEQYFFSQFENDDNLLSMFVIGSMSNGDYVPNIHNDYDLRLLVDSPSVEFIDRVKKCATDVIEELKSVFLHYEFQWSDRIGPARLFCDTLPTFTLHVLIFTQDSLRELPVMHRLSYARQYKILYGNDYIGEYATLKLNAIGLLDDTEGIRYCIRCLTEKLFCYQVWKKRTNIYVLLTESEEFDNVTGYEFFRYSVAKCYANSRDFAIQESDIELLHGLKKLGIVADELLTITFDNYTIDNQLYINRAIKLLYEIERMLRLFAYN